MMLNKGPMKMIDGKIFHVVRKPIYEGDRFRGWEPVAYFRTIPEAVAFISRRYLAEKRDA